MDASSALSTANFASWGALAGVALSVPFSGGAILPVAIATVVSGSTGALIGYRRHQHGLHRTDEGVADLENAMESEVRPGATSLMDEGPVKEAEGPGPIRFGRRSPEDKAKSLARSLVRDLIAYNPEKHKEALAEGNLQEVFGEEIEKSLKEYQEQVEPGVMARGRFFNDALNAILAREQSIFTLDD